MAGVLKEQENFHRACGIILTNSTKLLREALAFYKPPSQCPTSITVAKGGPSLSKVQQNIIKNIAASNSYKDCDVSLLYFLFRALVKGIKFKPTNGWNKVVHASATTLADDLERIRSIRNEDIGHSTDSRMTCADYTIFIAEMEKIMARADANYNGLV